MTQNLSRYCLAGAVLLASLPSAAQIKMTDYRRLVTPQFVQVSPNGKQVAFVKSVPNFKDDVRETSVEVVDVDAGSIHSLTGGSHVITSPRWSPNGDRIAFLMEVAPQVSQIFVVGSKGGSVRQVTHTERTIQQFSWSPDGERLAFVTPNDQPNAEAIKAHNDLFDIHDVGFLTNSMPAPSHLWLVSAKGGTPSRLTNGDWSVLETPPPFAGTPSDPSWSPDGKSIVFCRQANADDSDSDLTTVAVVDAATGSISMPTPYSTYEYQPAYSANGSIGYLLPHGPNALSVMDVISQFSGGQKNLSDGLDRDFLDFKWLPDGGVAMIASEGVKRYIWERDSYGQVHKIDLGGVYPTELNAGTSGGIAAVASSFNSPPEVYFAPGASLSAKQITNLNGTMRSLDYAKATEITWTSPDGEKCDGVLTYPRGYVEGRKYPFVMFIHGGPEQAATLLYIGFEGDLLRQSLAADGYLVLEPNYRGSDNLGNGHEHAIFRDPATGPAADLLSGIAAVEQLGIVDESRVAIAGHSYGGYLTSWLISHDHRWKCAVVSDGTSDWTQEYDCSADGNLAWVRDSMGGGPSDPQSADLYKNFSILPFAGNITTPTLLLSGTSDETVPVTQSYSLYHVLKDHKIPVRFIGLPGAHHLPDDPVRVELFYAAMEDWIKGYDK